MTSDKVIKSDEEWRASLTPEQYRIARQKGTERAFTGEYWHSKKKGVYHCVACGQPLYSSEAKFDSGTGWPSYWEPIDEDAVTMEQDRSYGMVRTEVMCSRCGAHLGHVFDDGPEPTGMRHCINSASLKLVEDTPGIPGTPGNTPAPGLAVDTPGSTLRSISRNRTAAGTCETPGEKPEISQESKPK